MILHMSCLRWIVGKILMYGQKMEIKTSSNYFPQIIFHFKEA